MLSARAATLCILYAPVIVSADKKIMRAEFRGPGPLEDSEEFADTTGSSGNSQTGSSEWGAGVSIESGGELRTTSAQGHNHRLHELQSHASLLEDEDEDDMPASGLRRNGLKDPSRECRRGIPGAGDCSGCYSTDLKNSQQTPLPSCCERHTCFAADCDFLYLEPSQYCATPCSDGKHCCSEVKCQTSCSDAGPDWRVYPTG
mmetsp:Transcript_3875/g.6742  ORF Transcript_3875/g.6742 Transcript_3875/m.6742 type:complete len:202 (+) Transcript_3875:87-692(+)